MSRPLLVVALLSGAVACGFSSTNSDVPPDAGADVDAPLPPATVGFAASTSTQDERSGNIQLAVVLSRPATSEITVPYRFVGGDATPGADYNASDGTLTFAVGDTEQAIPISITADTNDELNETILLELDAPTGDAVLGQNMHALTISASFLPRVSFSLAQSSQGETGGTVVLNLSLDAMSAVAIDVGYSIGGTATGTAGAFPDHTLAAGTVTFPPNTQSQTINLPISDDGYDEDNETVVVTLVTSVNAVVETLNDVDRRTHTIEDDDAPPTVAFSQAAASAQENNTTVAATATLSIRSEKTIVIPVALGTPATNPATVVTDFTVPAGTSLTFGPGQTSQAFNITVKEDNTDEFDELVEVVLGPGNENVTLGLTPTHTLTITNEDTASRVSFTTNSQTVNEGDSGTNAVSFNVNLDKVSGKPITIGVSVSGNAVNPDDYTIDGIPIQIPAGNTVGSLTVNVTTDETNEDNSNGTEDVDMLLVTTGSANVSINTNADFRRLTIRDDD